MKAPQKKCGTCRYLRPRDDGKPFYYGNSYKCEWTQPAIIWPASVSTYDPRRRFVQPGTHMQPGDGKDCPCWNSK